MKIRIASTIVDPPAYHELPIGTLARVQDVLSIKYNGHVVLRKYKGFVSLTDPGHEWANENCTLTGIPLPPGTEVTLIQE